MHKHQQNYFSIRIKMTISNATTVDIKDGRERTSVVAWRSIFAKGPKCLSHHASPTCANLPNTT